MSHDPTEFTRERDILIAEVAEVCCSPLALLTRLTLLRPPALTPSPAPAQALGRCVTNLNLLNRNIENVAVVGQGFEPVHTLWKQFEAVMANASVGASRFTFDASLPCCTKLT